MSLVHTLSFAKKGVNRILHMHYSRLSHSSKRYGVFLHSVVLLSHYLLI